MGDAVTKTNSGRSPTTSDPDSAGDSGHSSPEPEFLRVHAQLKGMAAAKHWKKTFHEGENFEEKKDREDSEMAVYPL